MNPEQIFKFEQLEAFQKFKSQIEQKIPDLTTLWADFRFTLKLNLRKGQQNLTPHFLN